MDLFDVATNKRIIAGNFPDRVLYPAEIEDYLPEDFRKQAESAFAAIKECPEMFSGLFCAFRNRMLELTSLNRSELYRQNVNFLINTGLQVDVLSPSCEVFQKAVNLVPAVTELDKILWTGVNLYYLSSEFDTNNTTVEQSSMMYAFLFLLLDCERKEQETGRTISIDRFIREGTDFNILFGPWNDDSKRYFVLLTNKEKSSIESLEKSRQKISKEIDAIFASSKKIAMDTSAEWEIFIEMLNDMSQKEASVIDAILEPISAKKKATLINQYKAHLYAIERGKYYLNGKEIQLLPVLNSVENRIQNASCYAKVYSDDEKNFTLFPTALLLLISPVTYNYLLMTFHLFRMRPDKDSAKEFVSLALDSIKKNLGIDEKSDHISISDMIEDFHSTVTYFFQKNEDAINRLSFRKILSDAVVSDSSLSSIDSSLYRENVLERFRSFESSEEYEKKIKTILLNKDEAASLEQVLKYVANEEKIERLKEQEQQAVQLVKSLNIIYMFCEGLRIILNDRRLIGKIKNVNKVEQYRKDLMLLDDKILHKVYEELDNQEIGMLEYREKTGIIAGILTDQESREEKYRNMLFSEILKNIIDDITAGIENQNTEQLLGVKKRIREEIMHFPECDEKDQYAQWLDGISNRINEALVEKCKIQDDYERTQKIILSNLGEKARMLPESTLDSLTTAEILFKRYATLDYADKGFDFSCISALYYQAFEEAYNKLIWQKYATYLNGIIIDGKAFTEILEMSRGIDIKDPNAIGYLDNNAQQRDFYIEYKSKRKQRPKTLVSSRCMYKSFAILLGNIAITSKLDKLCDFFAGLCGFRDRTEMFADDSFMKVFQDFYQKITDSCDYRNNASHGGTFISLEQCGVDKKTVLYELEGIRDDSLSLIQLLISILNVNYRSD